MNYLQFVNTVLDTSKSHKLVYEVGEGDIYEHLNSGDHKYPCVFLTVQNVDSNGDQMTVTGSLFYVDALLSDTSNKLQIQSTGMTTLHQIFMRLMDNYPDFDLRTGRYTPFDEKFSDLCAGVFSNFTISFMDDTCIFNDDIFEGDEPITPEPTGKYMTITVDSNAGETIIAPHIIGNLPKLNLKYRINNGKWNDFIFGTTSDIHVFAGDSVQWKGNNPGGVSNYFDDYLNFSISDLCHLSGNVMSLIDGIGETTVIPGDYSGFYRLFENSKIKTVSSDFLPATTLKTECYSEMFKGCTELTTAPVLPATDLTEHCYLGMFQNCTSLTTAPELPATVMALGCYNSMFKGCTSLTTAPVLPATQLYIGCYTSMFEGCTSLTTAPELPATTIYGGCYDAMFKGSTSLNYVKCLAVEIDYNELWEWLLNVAPTGTFVKKYGVEYLINSPSGIPQGWTVEEIDAPIQEPKYMTITVDSNAGETTISPTVKGSITPNLQYRINNGSWNDFIFGTTTDIHVVAGDVVQFKGLNPDGISTSYNDYLNFAISDNVHLSGSIMSLIDGIGECDTIPNNYCFCNLFNSAKVKTVSKYFLSATHLKENCYNSLFYWCKSLEVAPALHAEVLVPRCYNMTFAGCTALGNAPEINATTLAEYCFLETFAYCSSLKTTPELNYMNLEQGCYYEMFKQCTSLETAPALPATYMKSVCYYGLFDGCTSLKNPPVLPSLELAYNCYYRMFRGCTSLVNAPALPATVLSKNGGLSGCYESMFENCTSLVTPPALPATVLSNGCYNSMFKGCTSLETAPELPAESLEYYCYEQMFSGCEKLTQAPVLNSQTLVIHCYYEMFKNCKNLNYVKCLATNIQESSTTETSALTDWLYGVAPTGTFVKKYGLEYLINSPSGIPQGWTVEEIDAPTPPTPPVPEQKYMTITVDDAAGETTISPTVTGSLPNLNLQYRINNGDWTDFIVGTTADIKVAAGDFVQWKGNNPDGVSTSYNDYLNFVVSGNPVALSGNIMSLIDGVGDVLKIPNTLCFYYLFYNSAIKTVSSDFLPATTLQPECYRSLFAYCNKLTQAPALPATTLEPYCYEEMFIGCTSLTQAPELPATTLVDSCYNYMFLYCSSLNYVKCLATDIISTSTIFGWLSGVSSTGTFVKRSGVSYETGDSGIPSGWTIEEI